MNDVNKELEERQKKLKELHVILDLQMQVDHPRNKIARVNELQDRLEFRLKQYEVQLLDEKIKIFEEAISTLKS